MTSVYNKKETTQAIELYIKSPNMQTVDKICILLNKTRKSVIAKLSKEGVYITKRYTTKRGEDVITKLQLVRQIEKILGTKLSDLEKTPKTTLKCLLMELNFLDDLLQDAILEAVKANERLRVLDEMKLASRTCPTCARSAPSGASK